MATFRTSLTRTVVLGALTAIAGGLLGPLAATGCGGDDSEEESYDTYQECFDDHTVSEGLSVEHAITVCCLEHPIDGVKEVCGADEAACETYLGTNLASTSATSTQVTTACTDYATQKDM